MEIENRRMRILAAGMGKMNSDMRLVGAFIRGKPRIAIDTKQRTACGASVGNEMRTKLAQMRSKAADKSHGRLDRHLLVSRLVCREPLAVVVPLELPEEGEQLGLEKDVRHLDTNISNLRESQANS